MEETFSKGQPPSLCLQALQGVAMSCLLGYGCFLPDEDLAGGGKLAGPLDAIFLAWEPVLRCALCNTGGAQNLGTP